MQEERKTQLSQVLNYCKQDDLESLILKRVILADNIKRVMEKEICPEELE